ncbi:MAG: GntP family permease [Planctomycetaceae bacterium]|jgi:GntP family gluconate:H+ symporter|nr:GntP family permease [Planctomycetaceae bacterium]
MFIDPLFILLFGVLTVVGLVVFLRVNAFLSLLAAAMLVSFMTPLASGQFWDDHIKELCLAFGTTAGNIGILVAMGAIIGKCMLDSGSADRIVNTLRQLFGEKMIPAALLSSGFILSIPIFYDTTFYLLVPIARSLYKMMRKNYVLYLLSIGLGATLTHTLTPPAPAPVIAAETLNIPLGSLLIVSLLVAALTAPFALGIAFLMNRLLPHPDVHFEDESENTKPEHQNTKTEHQKDSDSIIPAAKVIPSLFWSFAPILIPVFLISLQSLLEILEKSKVLIWDTDWFVVKNFCRLLGDPRFALIIAAVISISVLFKTCKLSLQELGNRIETAIFSAGMIILITSAGGAFGAMLRAARIGERIEECFQNETALTGISLLLLSFVVTAIIKTAQGSSTVAMITSAGIFAGILTDSMVLPFHPAYLAVTIGLGSCVTGWMNDSGFWIFCRMGGIRETDALKTWTIGLILLGISGLIIVLILSQLLPLTILPSDTHHT